MTEEQGSPDPRFEAMHERALAETGQAPSYVWMPLTAEQLQRLHTEGVLYVYVPPPLSWVNGVQVAGGQATIFHVAVRGEFVARVGG